MDPGIESLRPLISQKLIEIDCFIDEELPEYIITMLENEKKPESMAEDLSDFLGAQAKPFVDWIEEKRLSVSNERGGGASGEVGRVQVAVRSSVGASTAGSLVSTVSRKYTPATGIGPKTATKVPQRKSGAPFRLLARAMGEAHKDTVSTLTSQNRQVSQPLPDEITTASSIPCVGLVSRPAARKPMIIRESDMSTGQTSSGVAFKVTLTGTPTPGVYSDNVHVPVDTVYLDKEPVQLPNQASSSKQPTTKFLVTLTGKAAASSSKDTVEDVDPLEIAPSLKVTINSKQRTATGSSTAPIHVGDTELAKTKIVITIPNEGKSKSTIKGTKANANAEIASAEPCRVSSSSASSSGSDSSSDSTSSGESSKSSSESDGCMDLSLESEDDDPPPKKPLPVASLPKSKARPSSVVIAPRKRLMSSVYHSGAAVAKKPRLDSKDIKSSSGLDVTCRKFPKCPYGRECSFLHPDCPDLDQCKDSLCIYRHPAKKQDLPSSSSRICKQASNCPRYNCPFVHPTSSSLCRFGLKCTRRDCSFRHPG